MNDVLLISVRLHEGRYHGLGDELPAPARMFQALVAGSGLSGPLSNAEIAALEWLERLDPPLIAAPRMWSGQSFTNYVPNNDLDTVGGDHHRVGAIKTSKIIKPRLFDAAIPILFAWSFTPDGESNVRASRICDLAERVYQFGRGVDFAWAWGEILEQDAFELNLDAYPGIVCRPTRNGSGTTIACPQTGSWRSLRERHERGGRRFLPVGKGKAQRVQFTQASKPRFVQIAYDSPPARFVFELRSMVNDSAFAPFPLARAPQLVTMLRNAAVDLLRTCLPNQVQEIERALIGRRPDGTNAIPSAARVRIIPLPSIGHQHVDAAIRRVLVEVPATCPLRSDDVCWAFSGLILAESESTSGLPVVFTRTDNLGMLAHYGIDSDRRRTWWTVTPIALPEEAGRRRIDPLRVKAEAKSGSERREEQRRAASSLIQSLRHVDIRCPVESVQLQREPLTANGQRVEAFAVETRFAKERLWHAQITFSEPIAGPLVIGDGRFLGLGLLAPVERTLGVHAFQVVDGLTNAADSGHIARSMRLAVIARVQSTLGRRVRLSPYFSGHDSDGSRTTQPHLAFIFDPILQTIVVIAPHVMLHQSSGLADRENLDVLDRALEGMSELRAGASGLLKLSTACVETLSDAVFGCSRIWETTTDYVVTRHLSASSALDALAINLRSECIQLGLPEPKVCVLKTYSVPGLGLSGRARLLFPIAVEGPIILGRNRYMGGGLFSARLVH
jgi:CRISPR-associated protein Csb2